MEEARRREDPKHRGNRLEPTGDANVVGTSRARDDVAGQRPRRVSSSGGGLTQTGQLLGRHASGALHCRAVTTERVRLVPACQECSRLWLPGDRDRWRAYWIDAGDEDELLFYCPSCAEREFAAD